MNIENQDGDIAKAVNKILESHSGVFSDDEMETLKEVAEAWASAKGFIVIMQYAGATIKWCVGFAVVWAAFKAAIFAAFKRE